MKADWALQACELWFLHEELKHLDIALCSNDYSPAEIRVLLDCVDISQACDVWVKGKQENFSTILREWQTE